MPKWWIWSNRLINSMAGLKIMRINALWILFLQLLGFGTFRHTQDIYSSFLNIHENKNKPYFFPHGGKKSKPTYSAPGSGALRKDIASMTCTMKSQELATVWTSTLNMGVPSPTISMLLPCSGQTVLLVALSSALVWALEQCCLQYGRSVAIGYVPAWLWWVKLYWKTQAAVTPSDLLEQFRLEKSSKIIGYHCSPSTSKPTTNPKCHIHRSTKSL